MKYVGYGGTWIMTSDAAAEAVLQYAAALAQSRLADVVRVPTVDVDGSSLTADVLLGPAIPVVVQHAPDGPDPSKSDEFIVELDWRTRAVQHGIDITTGL